MRQVFDWHLYVLKLENNKYYVGSSTDIDRRFGQHKAGKLSSKWTRKHKPLEIIETKYIGRMDTKACNIYESALTLDCMRLYGKENVRGGCYLTDNNTARLVI